MTTPLTHIDGVEIVARQKATTMYGSVVGTGAQVNSVEELLLADGRTLFHCVHKNTTDCTYTNPVMGGVMSHQRTHSDRMVAKRATTAMEEAKAEAARVQAELDERKRRKTEGGAKAAETRRANRAAAPVENGTPRARGPKVTLGDQDLARQAQNVITAFNAMQAANDEFQKVLIGYMRVVQTSAERPAIDPQILAKAQQYDVIQNALRDVK